MSSNKTSVVSAKPYQVNKLGSGKSTKFMFLRQYNFPAEYDFLDEELSMMDSDRIDYSHKNAYFKKYILQGENGFEKWILEESTTDDQVFGLIKDILGLPDRSAYTGYRVLGGVDANGYNVWTFQLFQKRPESTTKVYTGIGSDDGHAPNITY